MHAALGPAEALPDDAVEVGRVLGAWGVKGGIKVLPFAADAQALFSTKRWFLAPAEPARPGGLAHPVLLRIAQAREQGDGIVATVQDLDDRDVAESLKGARVFVPRTSFPTPDEGEFYWIDLIGMAGSARARGAVCMAAGSAALRPPSWPGRPGARRWATSARQRRPSR